MIQGTSFGFDDAGSQVPTVGFDYDALDGEDETPSAPDAGEVISGLLEFLTAGRRPGRAGALAIGRDCLLLAHLVSRRPESQAALARRMGVSETLVSMKLKSATRSAPLMALVQKRKRTSRK